MNYYKRHIGDYAKKAGHLSVLEHGVYTLLLDAYYDREKAPTKAEAIRHARTRTQEELAALDAVLSDFFTEIDGLYFQTRVEEEFKKAEEIAKLNKVNGIKGGRPRKPKGNRKITEPVIKNNPNITEVGGENNPNPLIHQSTNPLSKEESKAIVRASRLPQDWKPSDSDLAYCQTHRPELVAKEVADSFHDYWIAKSGKDATKTDWAATWRNWVRNQRAPPSSGQVVGKTMQGIQALEKMKNESQQRMAANSDNGRLAKTDVARIGQDTSERVDDRYSSLVA